MGTQFWIDMYNCRATKLIIHVKCMTRKVMKTWRKKMLKANKDEWLISYYISPEKY